MFVLFRSLVCKMHSSSVKLPVLSFSNFNSRQPPEIPLTADNGILIVFYALAVERENKRNRRVSRIRGGRWPRLLRRELCLA